MKARSVSAVLFFILSTLIVAQPPETIYNGILVKEGYWSAILPVTERGPHPIGFDFEFFGNTYSEFYLGVNGLIMFVEPSGVFNTEVTIPNTAVPNNYIASFWDNLYISDDGNIMYKTIGTPGTRKCIIQFKNMGFYPALTPLGTFSVILYEDGNKIQMQYRLIVDPYSGISHGESATIGLENADGSAGVLYKFHDPDAVHTGDAILFTPSGGTYTVNDNAPYDGVFLTTNVTLPDPGIPDLISPSLDAVIGMDHTFEWNAASNATSYILLIDVTPDLSTAKFYNIPSTSYDTIGLTLDRTYYWTVFASNATALSWNEVTRFTTSSTPPLTAIPREIWMTQGEEKTVTLQATGGDGSAKSAIVTSLPAQGELWQVSGGTKSSRITTVPETVTDPLFNLIYVANGATGNGAGTFNFKFHDDTGDSPGASYKINVNAPGIPNLLQTARNAGIELQFDLKMNDPSGKEGQFAINVDAVPVAITGAGLKANDPYSILLTLATPLTGTETVLVSYTKGDISAAGGGLLPSFADQPVTLLAQTITFTTSLDKKYGNPPFSLSASSSSGLTSFTYSSSNLGIATISGSTTTIRSVGTSEITARQAGNSTYAPARNVRTLTVAKGDQAITFGALPSKTFGDADFSISATASSGLTVTFAGDDPLVATIAGNLVHITGAGEVTITASQPGNTLWNAATAVQQLLSVDKADQTITFNPLPPKIEGDPDFDAGATASSGLLVSYSSSNTGVATIVSDLIHITGPGSAMITASQPGDNNYNAATDVDQELVVSFTTGTENPIINSKDFNVYVNLDKINIMPVNERWEGLSGMLRIYNSGGNLIGARKTLFNRNSLIQIQAPVTKGIYIIEIRSGFKKFTEKFVID